MTQLKPRLWFVLVWLAAGAAELAACGEPLDHGERDTLVGAWHVANGTRRLVCPGVTESTPFQTRIWFDETVREQILRTEADSVCEYRFQFNGNGAEIVAGQWCDEARLEKNGRVGWRSARPRSWSVRRLENGLLWETAILDVMVERSWGKALCTEQWSATLARVDR